MSYPKRGEMSEDGKYYTHTDGSVFIVNKSDYCDECFLRDECNIGKHFTGCRFAKCVVVPGAYVPSTEEQEACDMALAMIELCGQIDTCEDCAMYPDRTCPARAYLATHGDANAWEVAT